jgi:pimeloyl-ACP methyl ester carboxylesterase
MRLVLMPGMDGTGFLFDPLLRELTALGLESTVVSYPGARVVGYDELLAMVRSTLPTAETFVLVAESFSGPLAVRIAADPPAGLRGVVLCATFVQSPLRFLRPWLAPLVNPAILSLFPAVVRLRALAGGYSTPELRGIFERVHSAVRPAVLADRVREIMRVDVRRELAACRVPMLYLEGTRDNVVPPANVTAIKALNPSIVIEKLDAPHLVLQTAPAEAAGIIARFVAGLLSTRR